MGPLPFWPPEHRHEIEAWHADLDVRGVCEAELTFRRRDGGRIRVHVAGRTSRGQGGASRQLISVRDISAAHMRERRLADLAARDPETGLLNHGEFEERLRDAVRRAVGDGYERDRRARELGPPEVRGAASSSAPRPSSPSSGCVRSSARATRSRGRARVSSPGSSRHRRPRRRGRRRQSQDRPRRTRGRHAHRRHLRSRDRGRRARALCLCRPRAGSARRQGLGGTAQYTPAVGGPAGQRPARHKAKALERPTLAVSATVARRPPVLASSRARRSDRPSVPPPPQPAFLAALLGDRRIGGRYVPRGARTVGPHLRPHRLGALACRAADRRLPAHRRDRADPRPARRPALAAAADGRLGPRPRGDVHGAAVRRPRTRHRRARRRQRHRHRASSVPRSGQASRTS